MASENNGIFRKKVVDSIESPEEMHDYLQVTSSGIWLFLGAVTLLLIGVIIWGIFGRINTSVQVAVVAQEGECVCVVPYDKLTDVLKAGSVTMEYETLTLTRDVGEAVTVGESTDVQLRIAGEYEIGDIVVPILVEGAPEDGVYTGTVVTESLQPISLLLN